MCHFLHIVYVSSGERRWQLDDTKKQWRNRANSVPVFLVLVLFKDYEDSHTHTHAHVTGFIGRENSEVEKLVHHSLFNVTAFIIYQKSRPSVICNFQLSTLQPHFLSAMSMIRFSERRHSRSQILTLHEKSAEKLVCGHRFDLSSQIDVSTNHQRCSPETKDPA